jgi:hypothetical protein
MGHRTTEIGPKCRIRFSRLLVSGISAGAIVISALLAAPQVAGASTPSGSDGSMPFLDTLHHVTDIGSTVPKNGDVNPYGIVNVPASVGRLVEGETLISNFNASSNLQGTGTTIVQISRTGHRTVFARIHGALPGACPGGVGLTTALTILNGGYVVVGSLPVTDGGMGTPEAGCLIVLNPEGIPVETWSGSEINGPWDLTALQFPGFAQIFVTNVLNGTVAAGGSVVNEGTVVRLDIALLPNAIPRLLNTTVVGSGFAEQLNAAAVVLGPTGVALGQFGTLYVADTVHSRIAFIPFAPVRDTPVTGGGYTLTSGGGLNSPLGLAIAPNDDVIAVNAADGNAVETTPWGDQVAVVQMDPLNSGGDLFGLTISPNHKAIMFVDDGNNTLDRFRP